MMGFARLFNEVKVELNNESRGSYTREPSAAQILPSKVTPQEAPRTSVVCVASF